MKNLIKKWLGIDDLETKSTNLKKIVNQQGKKIKSLSERVKNNLSKVNGLHHRIDLISKNK